MKKLTSETSSKLINAVKEIYNWKNGFCGPQPISIERKHLSVLKNDYYASFKADGIRFCFVCLKYQNKNLCLFFDRKLDVYQLRMHVPREFFKGTLVDGEIITHNGKTYFLGFDCMMVSGKNTSDLSFRERLDHVDVVCKSVSSDFFNFKTKLFKNLTEFTDEDGEFPSDGYIFMPNNEPIKFGTHNTFFKLKAGLDNTVDFVIDEKHKLCLIKSGTLTKTMNKIDYSLISKEQIIPNSVYECKFAGDKLWLPMSQRTDKTSPNSYYVYQRTLVNIKENISMSEILQHLQ